MAQLTSIVGKCSIYKLSFLFCFLWMYIKVILLSILLIAISNKADFEPDHQSLKCVNEWYRVYGTCDK